MIRTNCIESIATSIRANWDQPAFSDWQDISLKYHEVGEKILQLHALFDMYGIEPGDKLAVIGRNSTNWALCYLATISYGAVIVPILPDFKTDELHHIINHSEAKILFTSEQAFDQINETKVPAVEAVFSLVDFSLLHQAGDGLGEDSSDPLERYVNTYQPLIDPVAFRFKPVANDQLAAIVYTSGTTGFSKGVMLSHNSLIGNIEFYLRSLDINAGDTVLSFLPLGHAFGCTFDFLAPFCGGAHITFITKLPTPKILLTAFAEVKPRVIFSVPLIIEKIYRNRIKPLLAKPRLQFLLKVPGVKRLIYNKIRKQLCQVFGGNFYEVVIGGAALNEEVEQFFLRVGFPFTIGYGMTECGPLITYEAFRNNRPAGSVGKPVSGMEIRVQMTDAEHGIGEILTRGEHLMEGYFKDTEASEEAIDSAGWLHTGDLGRVDDDGNVYLTGRSKNMILSASGQNIYPEEIESRLNGMPLVQESLVLDNGGHLVALVYPDIEVVDTEHITQPQLAERMEQNRRKLNEVLPAYSAISRIRLYPEEFEKTPTKKIKRRLYNILS